MVGSQEENSSKVGIIRLVKPANNPYYFSCSVIWPNG
jgi:hypothetical protein